MSLRTYTLYRLHTRTYVCTHARTQARRQARTRTRVIFGVYSDTRQSTKHQAVLQRTRPLQIFWVVGTYLCLPPFSINRVLSPWCSKSWCWDRPISVGVDVGVFNARPFASGNRDVHVEKWSASECMTECDRNCYYLMLLYRSRSPIYARLPKVFAIWYRGCYRANNLWAITRLIGATKSLLRIFSRNSKDWTYLRSL